MERIGFSHVDTLMTRNCYMVIDEDKAY